MKLDIEKIIYQVGGTTEQLAKDLCISHEDLLKYCSDSTEPMSQEFLAQICKHTGLLPDAIFVKDNSTTFNSHSIQPENTFESSEDARTSLVDFIRQGLQEIDEPVINNEIKVVERCVKALRKPRISFAGQSDTGKSTLINALLGAEHMPAKWTPTTSIVVHIKHTDDRPSFMTEDVWVFGANSSGKWDDSQLSNQNFCNEYMIDKGDFSLLSTYGTHQHEKENQKVASEAVAFIDSPLLKNCEILDLPGFAANSEDDALHKFNTQENITDILLYLSRANGFLQDRDLDYLRECIKSLRPAEQQDSNDIGKLENLFIIASQAGTVGAGNFNELKEILDRRCTALCDIYQVSAEQNHSNTLLEARTQLTGYVYCEEDFRKRFFTYEKDMPRLCKNFEQSFTTLAEKLPKAMYGSFAKNLKEVIDHSKTVVGERATEWKSMLDNKAEYSSLVREIKAKEPARKVEQKNKNKEINEFIESCRVESRQDIQSAYTEIMNEESLVKLIEERGIQFWKESQQDFVTMVNELLTGKIQSILSDKSSKYAKEIDEYLSEYSNTFSKCSDKHSIKLEFDSKNSFVLGLASLGVLGASATWLATSLTAWTALTFGSLLGWGPILAVGGVVGIALGALVAGVIALVTAVRWKQQLANSIIKAYTKGNYIDLIFTEVDKYWKDTQSSFTYASEKVEEDWRERISEYELIADEKNISILQSKLSAAYKGLDFFTKIPMPDIG